MANVGKYTSPMDPMGYDTGTHTEFIDQISQTQSGSTSKVQEKTKTSEQRELSKPLADIP